jgi:hypothetical protein
MNYIEVIKAVWKWYQSSMLEPNDYCLMMRLIAISNDDMGWEDCFLRNNYELIGTTKLSYKQLQNSRNKLQQLGLISFEQRNGLANCKYKIHFKALLNLSKKSEGVAKVTARLRQGEGVDKLNLNETKLNDSFSEPQAASVVPKKNRTEKETTEYWGKLVEAWFDFYGLRFKDEAQQPQKPVFNKKEGEHLKKIISYLKKKSIEAGKEWEEEYAIKCLRGFLFKAWNHDTWFQNNFELGNMLSKFNAITNSNGNGNGKSNSNRSEKPATNAAAIGSHISYDTAI